MKPVIGVTPLYDDKRGNLLVPSGYMDALMACGAMPVILPLTDGEQDVRELLDMCRGFLFTGGHDVAPGLYGEEPLPGCGPAHEERDKLEGELLRQAFEADRPIFGICRGIQVINVLMGGTLYQDIPSQCPDALRHHMLPLDDVPWHQVELKPETPLYRIFQRRTLKVNSYHHQAVKELAPGLVETARSPDGFIEGVYCLEKSFVLAVQWHPELMWETDEGQLALIQSFVDACGR